MFYFLSYFMFYLYRKILNLARQIEVSKNLQKNFNKRNKRIYLRASILSACNLISIL